MYLCRMLLLLPPVEASRAELALELVPANLLPKLQRMVQLMTTAQYAPAQHGYAALRERALQQVRLDLKCCWLQRCEGTSDWCDQ
jgi:hypothetical protein